MRGIKKADVLRMLEEIKTVVKKLPDDVTYRRFFLADDGRGVILETGISAAAEAMGETVQEKDWGTEEINWKMLQIQTGGMTIYQLEKGDQL